MPAPRPPPPRRGATTGAAPRPGPTTMTPRGRTALDRSSALRRTDGLKTSETSSSIGGEGWTAAGPAGRMPRIRAPTDGRARGTRGSPAHRSAAAEAAGRRPIDRSAERVPAARPSNRGDIEAHRTERRVDPEHRSPTLGRRPDRDDRRADGRRSADRSTARTDHQSGSNIRTSIGGRRAGPGARDAPNSSSRKADGRETEPRSPNQPDHLEESEVRSPTGQGTDVRVPGRLGGATSAPATSKGPAVSGGTSAPFRTPRTLMSTAPTIERPTTDR